MVRYGLLALTQPNADFEQQERGDRTDLGAQ
jgi:hypothetical protein